MANLMSAISAAITKSLMAKLPAEAAEKFDLEEDEFKEFLSEFLATQLKGGAKGGAKGGRSNGPKGKNGKGRISGYILFSGAHRQEVKDEDPDVKFTEVGKALGKMWGKLSDKEKAKWNVKAAKQNEENGLPTPTPGAKKTTKKAPVKKTTKKAPVKKTSKKNEAPMKITRDKDAQVWLIDGTKFVVQSPKNKVVLGKLRGTKVVALSITDKKQCIQSGWEVKADQPVATKKDEPEPDDEDEDEDDEDEDEDEDDEDEDDEDDDEDEDDDDDEDDEDDELLG